MPEEDRPAKQSWDCFGGLCPPFGPKPATTNATPPIELTTVNNAGVTSPRPTHHPANPALQLGESSSARSSRLVIPTPKNRPTSPLPASVVSRTDSRSLSRSNTQPDSSPTVFQELWEAALTKLRAGEDGKETIDMVDTFINKVSGKIEPPSNEPTETKDLAVLVKDEMEDEIKGRRHDGRATRFLQTVVSSLNKFVSVGDVAVSFDPVHAALPWAGVRFVLVMITAGSDLRNQLMEGIAKVSSLFLACDTYVRLYLNAEVNVKSLPPDILGNLKTAIVESYAYSMKFLCYAVRQRQQQQINKIIKAPLQLDDVKDYFSSLGKLGQGLAHAGDVCEKFCSSYNRSAAHDLLEIVKDLQRSLQDSTGMALTKYQEDLLAKLPTAGAAFDHIDSQGEIECHPETRVELLKQIHDWIREPHGRRTFWLQGLAGTGKSTISRTIARNLDGNMLGASFFFKRGNSGRDDGRCFFTTIAYQLACRLPSLREHICAAIKHEPKIVNSLLEVQFQKFISGPLRNLEEEGFSDALIIVVDALDECENQSHTKAIINLLTKNNLKCFKVFLTSRPEYDIRRLFSYAEGRHEDLVLHRIDKDVIEHDIRVVLISRICDFRRDYNLLHADEDCELSDDWPGEQKLSLLVKMCTPLFISVATFFRLLQLHNWPETPDGKVDFILQNSATSEYGSLYYPVLCRMMMGLPRAAEETAKDGFKNIVGSIILLANPLSAKSLSRLLSVNRLVVDSRLESLHSVLDMPKGNAPIRLFHLSFRDFLTHEDAQDFRISEPHTHNELGTRCLELLSNYLKKDICGVKSPGKPRDEFSQDLITKYLPDEIKYASLHWVHHIKASQCKIKDGGMVHRFLLKCFLNWLEALSLLGSIHSATSLLKDLEALTDTSTGVEVSEFLYDAKRFTMSFGTITNEVPLQVYNSALVFAPMRSLVRRTFQSDFPDWLDKTHPPVVESDWSPLLLTLEGHWYEINCTAFSSRGWLASSDNKTIKIWDVSSGACIHTLDAGGTKYGVERLVFSRCGNLLAWASRYRVNIWDTENAMFLKPASIHDDRHITSMTFADDLSQLFLVDNRCSVWFCEIQTGKISRTFTEFWHHGNKTFAAISESGKWFAGGSGNNNIINLTSLAMDSDAVSLQLVSPRKKTIIKEVAFSSSAEFLISLPRQSVGETCDIEVWDTASGEFQYTLEGPGELEIDADFQFHKDQIALKVDGWSGFILDLERRVILRQMNLFYRSAIDVFAISKDGTLLAHCVHTKIQIWDMNSVLREKELVDPSRIRSVEFASDSSLLVSSRHEEVTVWDVFTNTPKQTIRFPICLDQYKRAVSRKAQALAMGFDGKVEIWNIDLGLRMQTLAARYDLIWALSFSDDGKLLACGSQATRSELPEISMAVEIWDTEKGIHVGSPYEYDETIFHVVMSPNGKQVVISKETNTYPFREISDVITGVVYGKVDTLQGLAFTPDGRNIIAFAAVPRLNSYLWNAETGECVLKWNGKVKVDNLSIDSKLLNLVHAVSSELNLRSPFLDFERGYHENGVGWVVKDGEEILWLPYGYRPFDDCTAKSGNNIAIGSRNGRVMIYRFK